MSPCTDCCIAFEQENPGGAAERASALRNPPACGLLARSGDLSSMTVLASVAAWALRRSYNTMNHEGERE